MRFTRLRLNGFKSFVDPTELVIAEGLTGVVGPNGCGKSNLLEALRWVMGENRPTAMRGAGMEDVIFAGSAARPARHFAEVALSIDNAARTAPAAFNTADQLEVARRITRDAGSAYRVNGREARARDVQMLFADASTGAHSPALVRQGQIAELISARPRARRRVLEDAAGIAGLHARRHEAELRLGAAETNLARVADLLDGLAAQLAQLHRQARQAARYREIGEALRAAEGVLLWRRWSDAEAAHAAARAAAAAALRTAATAEGEARAAAHAREAAEEALPPARDEDAVAAAILQRAAIERDTLVAEEERARAAIVALEQAAAQIDRDAAREATLDHDAAETIAALEAEAQRLSHADDGFEARLDAAAQTAEAAGEALPGLEAALGARTEAVAALAAQAQAAARAHREATEALARTARDAEAASAEAGAAADTLARLDREAEAAALARAEAAARSEAAEAAEAEAEAARADLQSREAEARAARARADGAAGALRAEVEALARLVARDGTGGDRLLDRLTVTPGYEAALGAALEEDLDLPEASGHAATGWVGLGTPDAPPALPAGAQPLAAEVTAPAVLARRLARVGVVPADAGGRLQPLLAPGQRLVSAQGDLWRWDGLRRAADAAPGAAALRLRQINRLGELRRDLDAAAAEAEAAAEAHAEATEALGAQARALDDARQTRRLAERAALEAGRAQARCDADRERAAARRDAAVAARDRLATAAAEAEARLAAASVALADLPDLSDARAALEAERAAVATARSAAQDARAAHDSLRREGEARRARAATVARDLARWQSRRAQTGTRLAELEERRARAEADLRTARARPAELEARRLQVAEAVAAAEARRARSADALAAAEAALRVAAEAERTTERAASQAREARAAADARAAAEAEGVARATAAIEEATGAGPDALNAALSAQGTPELPDAEHAEATVARLRRQREALGAVNLRAEEDARAVQAEHDQLAAEKADLEAAIARLRSGIGALNREGRERLLTAFEQVNANFAALFTHLFGGGEARLTLVESDDPLEAGLEILCQPPGKKLATLSLLSGGEQTLTALALIFGVFLTNPSPICVLDEVDAPLDDANVARFCDLLDEMTRRTETRFLIITHNAVSMSRMDRLFGVTMAEQGVSQLVSVDLRRAEALVA
ncbi:MAG: chromosome segregation SMC family protein [Alkalilacustris sp.]